jgi:hypothetical protein
MREIVCAEAAEAGAMAGTATAGLVGAERLHSVFQIVGVLVVKRKQIEIAPRSPAPRAWHRGRAGPLMRSTGMPVSSIRLPAASAYYHRSKIFRAKSDAGHIVCRLVRGIVIWRHSAP